MECVNVGFLYFMWTLQNTGYVQFDREMKENERVRGVRGCGVGRHTAYTI